MGINRRTLLLILLCLVFFSQMVLAETANSESEIYTKLKCCSCEDPFEKCECPEAREMKSYIDAFIENGLSKEEIFYKVAKKFSLNSIIDKQLKAEIEKRFIKEAGTKRPQIKVEPESFNFGKAVKKQGKIRKIFDVYNKGNAVLIIKNIRVSCGCVSASLRIGGNKSPYFGVAGAAEGWQVLIEPDKSAELEVVLDLAHESMGMGKQAREVFVSSNDPLYPQTRIGVEIEVEK